ncbi:MAG TPA: hypothetical protein VFL92_05050 [Sphingomonas sp.]|nr:hypothetical protein [Sphingomonas sp.]
MQDCCRHICLGCALQPEAPPGPAIVALARLLPPVALGQPAPVGRSPGLDPPPPRARG